MPALSIIIAILLQMAFHPAPEKEYLPYLKQTTENTLVVSVADRDSLIFDEVMRTVVNSLPPPARVGPRMVAAGSAFLGTPYVASTLEAEGEERLIINLRGVDCTTFVEYVTAIAIRSRTRMNKFDDFSDELTNLRYRGGVIDGYPSRLHYFTEWLKDNERKGYLTLVSDKIGNEPMEPVVNFMTSNPQHYRQLQEDPSLVKDMAAIEKGMSGYNMRYITKDRIEQMADHIEDGDIIAFVTTIEGLDVSHTGLAIHQNGRLHLLHASLRSKEVEITSEPLSEYLKGLRNVSGILVARVG
jgi:hypothetical protein